MYCSLAVLALIFFMVNIASQNFHQRSHSQASCITQAFFITYNNLSQHILLHLCVNCSRKSTEKVLELLEVMYNDGLKGARIH